MGQSSSKDSSTPPQQQQQSTNGIGKSPSTPAAAGSSGDGGPAAGTTTAAGNNSKDSGGDGSDGCPYKKASGEKQHIRAPSWAWGCPYRGKEVPSQKDISDKSSADAAGPAGKVNKEGAMLSATEVGKGGGKKPPPAATSAPWWAIGCPYRGKEVPNRDSRTVESAATTNASSCTEKQTGCPVKQPQPQSQSSEGCPVKHQQPQYEGCPVKQHPQYNVYSQPINPTNQMPSVANQLPSPNQTVPLSTNRVSSTIPKGGGGAGGGMTWTYPSPQMFYNALTRKNKTLHSTVHGTDAATEEQTMMATVVALHNNMNETTWDKIMEWERLSDTSGSKPLPHLLRFCGRPMDLSPKARFKHVVLGHPLPFDRHDWVVLREDGTEVRYVIDYYHDETRPDQEDYVPLGLSDRRAVKSILLDVRPALDGPTAFVRRGVVMPLSRRGLWGGGGGGEGKSPFEPLPMIPTAELKTQVEESERLWEEIQQSGKRPDLAQIAGLGDGTSSLTGGTAAEEEERALVAAAVVAKMSRGEAVAHAKSFARMLKDCQDATRKMEEACADTGDDGNDDDGTECARATLAVTMCTAKIVCPLQYGALQKSLHADDEDDGATTGGGGGAYDARVDAALENATLCVVGANEKIVAARRDHPDLFDEKNQ